MPTLEKQPTLAEYQRYVRAVEQERGFVSQSAIEKCLLLGEEVGELFKAVRKASQLKTDPTAEVGSVADELADILIYVASIANRFDVDLEAAFRAKEQRNQQRRWT